MVGWFTKNLPVLRPYNGRNKRGLTFDGSSTSFSQAGDPKKRTGAVDLSAFEVNLFDNSSQGLNVHNKSFYADFSFKKQIFSTVKALDKLPALKKTIQVQMNEWEVTREKEAAHVGYKGARLARKDLKKKSD